MRDPDDLAEFLRRARAEDAAPALAEHARSGRPFRSLDEVLGGVDSTGWEADLQRDPMEWDDTFDPVNDDPWDRYGSEAAHDVTPDARPDDPEPPKPRYLRRRHSTARSTTCAGRPGSGAPSSGRTRPAVG